MVLSQRGCHQVGMGFPLSRLYPKPETDAIYVQLPRACSTSLRRWEIQDTSRTSITSGTPTWVTLPLALQLGTFPVYSTAARVMTSRTPSARLKQCKCTAEMLRHSSFRSTMMCTALANTTSTVLLPRCATNLTSTLLGMEPTSLELMPRPRLQVVHYIHPRDTKHMILTGESSSGMHTLPASCT